jgi:mono/diheme cytochrome c family protein
VTLTERSSNEFQSEVRKSELDYCLFERSVKCVSSSVAFSTAQAATQSPELTADAAQGRHLFVMNCAHCHGLDARGEGPDLHNLHRSDARIREVITAGIKGEMPSFGKELGEPDVRQLIAYLRTLHG